jgi:hypothetical protein
MMLNIVALNRKLLKLLAVHSESIRYPPHDFLMLVSLYVPGVKLNLKLYCTLIRRQPGPGGEK